MKFLILSEWKFMDQIPCWQCISLILNSGECFVGDLEPIEYLAAYDQNDMLKYVRKRKEGIWNGRKCRNRCCC